MYLGRKGGGEGRGLLVDMTHVAVVFVIVVWVVSFMTVCA